jgi:hypothetical protein
MRAYMLACVAGVEVCSGFPDSPGVSTSAGRLSVSATNLKRVEVNPCHLSTNHAGRS